MPALRLLLPYLHSRTGEISAGRVWERKLWGPCTVGPEGSGGSEALQEGNT